MSKKSKKKIKLKKLDYRLLLEGEPQKKPEERTLKIPLRGKTSFKATESASSPIVEPSLVKKELLFTFVTFSGLIFSILVFKLVILKYISLEKLGEQLFKLLNIG